MIGVGSPYNPHLGPFLCSSVLCQKNWGMWFVAWPTATCVFGVLQMLGASQLGLVDRHNRYGQERPCFVFTRRPGWRGKAGTQAWGSYSPVSWQKKYRLLRWESEEREEKGRDQEFEDLPFVIFGQGIWWEAFTLPYQIAGRSSHRSFCMIYDVIEWDMVIMVWYGMVGYAMESATDGRDRFLMVISRKRWDVWWWWRSREVFFCTVSNAINWLRKPPRLSILAIFFANVFFLNKQLRYFTRTRGVFREARLKKKHITPLRTNKFPWKLMVRLDDSFSFKTVL